MSGNVGSVIFWSGIVENVGIAVGIASRSVSVQKLFPLPVSTYGFVADIWVSVVGLLGILEDVRSTDDGDIMPCACAEPVQNSAIPSLLS